MSRLGLSHDQFDDLTPLELDLALKDHGEYHHAWAKEAMRLNRYIGTILRNKGLKESQQITDVVKFWRFPWEKPNIVRIPTSKEWSKLDKKYIK